MPRSFEDMFRNYDQELAEIERTRVTTNDKTRADGKAEREGYVEAGREFPDRQSEYDQLIAQSESREKDFISRSDELAANKRDQVEKDRAANEQERRESTGLEFKDPPIPPHTPPANENQWRVIEGTGGPPQSGTPAQPANDNQWRVIEGTPAPPPPPDPPAKSAAEAPAPTPPQSPPEEESSFGLRDLRDSWVGKAVDKIAQISMGLGIAGHVAHTEPAQSGPGPSASRPPISGPQIPGEGEGQDEGKGAKETKDAEDRKKTDWQKGVDAVDNAYQNAKSAPPPTPGGSEPPQESQGPRQLTTVYGLELKPPPPLPPPPPENDNTLSEGKGK